jgi:hypothetical protein
LATKGRRCRETKERGRQIEECTNPRSRAAAGQGIPAPRGRRKGFLANLNELWMQPTRNYLSFLKEIINMLTNTKFSAT